MIEPRASWVRGRPRPHGVTVWQSPPQADQRRASPTAWGDCGLMKIEHDSSSHKG